MSSRVPDTIGATSTSTRPSSGRAAASSSVAAARTAPASRNPRRTRPRSVLCAIVAPQSLATTGKPIFSAAATAPSGSLTVSSSRTGTPTRERSRFESISDRVTIGSRSVQRSSNRADSGYPATPCDTCGEVTPPDFSLIDDYLQELWNRQASDLLLTAGSPPLLRIDGALVPMDGPALTAADTAKIVDAMLDVELHERFRTEMEVDFSFGRAGLARFRVNAFHQRGAAAIALRLIPFTIPTFAELDLPAICERIVALPTASCS